LSINLLSSIASLDSTLWTFLFPVKNVVWQLLYNSRKMLFLEA
jgi:hypothetical protein